MIAVLGVMFGIASAALAVLALYGRKEIIQAAERAAEARANEFLEKNMTAEGFLGRYLNQMTPPRAEVATSGTSVELLKKGEVEAKLDGASSVQAVAEAYPGEEGADVPGKQETADKKLEDELE